jgi:hypothetical protein
VIPRSPLAFELHWYIVTHGPGSRIESAPGTDFQLLHCTKSRCDPGTADMTDGLSGLNWGAHDPSLP